MWRLILQTVPKYCLHWLQGLQCDVLCPVRADSCYGMLEGCSFQFREAPCRVGGLIGHIVNILFLKWKEGLV